MKYLNRNFLVTILCATNCYSAVPENIHTYPLYLHNGRSMEIRRGNGMPKAKDFKKEKYGAKLEFPEGWGGCKQKQTSHGGGVDVILEPHTAAFVLWNGP